MNEILTPSPEATERPEPSPVSVMEEPVLEPVPEAMAAPRPVIPPPVQYPAAPQPVQAPRRSVAAVIALLLSVAAVLLSASTLVLVLRGDLPPVADEEPPAEIEEPSEPETPPETEERAVIVFREQQIPVENVALNEYDPQAFITEDSGHITYEAGGMEAIPGVDVSAYQKDVDWKQVKASGMEFAMIRVGFRGYGSAGVLVQDEYFERNITGALEAGLKVGVYFFSQAINMEEAREEAQFVLNAIAGYQLDYPVVFDWERITNGDNARTDGLSGKAVTLCAQVFCEEIAAAGYTPAVYFNQTLGYLSLELEELAEYPFWLAAYSARPGFHYHFDMWQYTAKGRIPGIQGDVDLNLSFRDFSEEQAKS